MSASRLISVTTFQIMRPTLLNRGLKGKKNGDLLRAAEITGYDVLLTVDQGIPHQQPSAGRTISTILVRSRPNQIEDLPLVDTILDVLETIQPGQTVSIPKSD